MLCAVILSPGILASGQTEDQSGVVEPSFALSVTAAQDAVKAGSSVTLTITLTNTSDRKIQVVKEAGGRGPLDLRLDVRDGQGNTVRRAGPKLSKEKNGRIVKHIYVWASSVTNVDLPPGQKVTDVLPVDRLFDLTQPGKYSIQASRYDSETKTWVKSNTVTVTVTQ